MYYTILYLIDIFGITLILHIPMNSIKIILFIYFYLSILSRKSNRDIKLLLFRVIHPTCNAPADSAVTIDI